ncbi:IclR family transcriptional regulator [Paenisporosarcina indica]|uniref:IclR family transcriptional regulator n=1 Tax=Paenisporosarcina indica TaxID=650093 RepID=UPI0009501486|nr:IclR family transcriptional regulator [Paenisporosarcina indica]
MIQSVDRALQILEFLRKNPRGLGVTEISISLQVAKSTAHRLLMSLEEHGYVQKFGRESTYRLGLKFIEMNYTVTKNLNVLEIARPFIESLSKETGEIVHLVTLEGQEIIYIDKVENSSTIRIYSQIGRRGPLYCTAVGKSILAFLDEREAKKLVDKIEFARLTDYTLVNREALATELATIKKDKYSYDNQEHEMGIRCVGAPIFDHNGRPQYALSVTGPLDRMSDEILQHHIPLLKDTAKKISRSLGYIN